MTRRDARRRNRGGFTLIEVMVSLGVMTVGAMAVIALQQHTVRANTHARELTTAMNIAQMWVERIKQDNATWTQAGFVGTAGQPTPQQVLQNTNWLNRVNVLPNVFQTIVVPAWVDEDSISNAFDFNGKEVSADASNVHFCASFRPAWVYVGRALRVDVRVWWARAGTGADINTDFPQCADDGVRLSPGGAMFNNYHVVYLPTVVRMLAVVQQP
ncbi:MAG: prepilin-type N-terminal cleavage/methylation domain-containing protein [Myxococcales bacterium]|jgi:prepilin-type N-terminal cleavage/methylation domain-containing protein